MAIMRSKSITIEHGGEQKFRKILDDSDIELTTEPDFKVAGMVTLCIIPIYRDVVVEKYPPGEIFHEIRENSKEKVSIIDFKGSEKFYNCFRKDKPKSPKIVSDEFSVNRAKAMYEYIARIETKLRDGIKIDKELNIAPKNYKKNLPDSRLSQIDLTEYLERILLRKSSEDYFLKHALGAETHDELVAARNLTVLDEENLPYSEEDFRKFIRIRNAIMHFRVITHKDCEALLVFYGKFEQHNFEVLLQSINGEL